MPPISIHIIFFNEAKRVQAAIENLRSAHDVIVVNSGISVGTVDVADSFGCTVIQALLQGSVDLRNLALVSCPNESIFDRNDYARCPP